MLDEENAARQARLSAEFDALLRGAPQAGEADGALTGARLQMYRGDALFRRPILAASMFRDRAAQFKQRHKWGALRLDDLGLEYDAYDRQDALYVAVEDGLGRHCASGRILPTTAPNMINDLFTEALGGQVCDPLTWEVTRVCVSPRLRLDSPLARAALPAIFWAGMDLALEVGVKTYLGIYARPMRRVYRANGVPVEPLGWMESPEGPIEAASCPVLPEIRDELARRAGPLAARPDAPV